MKADTFACSGTTPTQTGNPTTEARWHEDAEQSVENKSDYHLRISGRDARCESIDHEKCIADDLTREVSQNESDEHRQERCESRIDAKRREKASRWINKSFRDLSDLESESSDRSERIRVREIKDQAKYQKQRKD